MDELFAESDVDMLLNDFDVDLDAMDCYGFPHAFLLIPLPSRLHPWVLVPLTSSLVSHEGLSPQALLSSATRMANKPSS